MKVDITEMKIRNLNQRRAAIGERHFGKKNKSLSEMERKELQMLCWEVVKLKRSRL